MKKNKVFSVLTTGLLTFSVGAPSVLAATPLIVEELQDREAVDFANEEISILEIIEVEETYIIEEMESWSFALSQNEELILIGEGSTNFDLQLSTENDTVTIQEEDFYVVLPNSEATIRLINEEENIYEWEIYPEDIKVEFGMNEDQIEEVEEPEEESLEDDEETEDDQPEEEVEEDQEESDDEHPLENVEIEEEESAALNRSSEVREVLEGENEEEVNQILQARSVAISQSRTHQNGVYTVQSGDNFNRIAESFGLTPVQLRVWNGHISNINNISPGDRLAVTREGVESMLSSEERQALHQGNNESMFNSVDEFIDYFAPLSIEISNEEGEEALYPSLMIAQAIHESGVARDVGMSQLSRPPYHNLSGIKARGNVSSVLMWTWEEVDGVAVDVSDYFQTFPSYEAALDRYANLLRYGRGTGEDYYYRGTWRSNTEDVWEVLEEGGLRGYATDSSYFEAIERIINQYNLTQFDEGFFQVRTGTFLGEAFTQQQINALQRLYPEYSYSMVEEPNVSPYRYRRIQSTEEFLGEAGAQRAIDRLKSEQGWHATMQATGNSTPRYRVQSGFFNSRAEIDRAVQQFRDRYGLHATVVRGEDNRYRMQTGFFNGREAAQVAIDFMAELNWWSQPIATGDSTPHYTIRTGEFNTPSAVQRAENYFNAQGWGATEIETDRVNPYYRIFVGGFPSEGRAQAFVDNLKNRHNWHSIVLPID